MTADYNNLKNATRSNTKNTTVTPKTDRENERKREVKQATVSNQSNHVSQFIIKLKQVRKHTQKSRSWTTYMNKLKLQFIINVKMHQPEKNKLETMKMY